uniref:Uncharacterized protein LOC111128241 isoform X1 n=1 Tax=Crassostrea virginica TaxID=6565 RepID=A0A8B8DNV5_CRAVI|nr:uncharacterized protein LOC111128241 isoform X1 [Crassostrea virginica]
MMKFLLFLAILLVSAHYSQQDSETEQSGELSDSVEEKPVQLPARDLEDEEDVPTRSILEDEATEEDNTAVQLPARDAEEDDELTNRSVQGYEEGTPVQLPARKLGELTKRSKEGFKIGKATTCEGQSLTLRCGRGRVIRVVYAIYGRRNRRVCAKNKPIKTTKCRAKNSKKIAVKTCDGKRTCQLKANNGVFGDPCIGTFKYLTVIYGCRKPCVKNAYFNGRVCKCKTGFKGQGYRRCTKQKVGRNLEEEEKRDVSDDDMDINENGLETV